MQTCDWFSMSCLVANLLLVLNELLGYEVWFYVHFSSLLTMHLCIMCLTSTVSTIFVALDNLLTPCVPLSESVYAVGFKYYKMTRCLKRQPLRVGIYSYDDQIEAQCSHICQMFKMYIYTMGDRPYE